MNRNDIVSIFINPSFTRMSVTGIQDAAVWKDTDYPGGEPSLSHPSFAESHEDRPAKANGTWGFPRQEISKVKRLTNYFGI